MASINTYSNTAPKRSLLDRLKNPFPQTGVVANKTPAQQAIHNSFFGKPAAAPVPVKEPEKGPVKSEEKNMDGSTKTTYHAPVTPTGPLKTPTPVAKTSAPTAPTPQVGNQMQNAQNVLNASQPNAMAQGAANAAALYGTLGNVAGLQPYAGRNDGLLQSFSDLSRPQSTGNIAGEKGLFDTKNAIFQNAANTSAAQFQKGSELATTGASNVLSAGQPQAYSPTQKPFNPLTGEFGQFAGTAGGQDGLFNAGQVQGQLDLGTQYPQLQSAHAQSQGIKSTIKDYITANPQLNPSDVTLVNSALQWAQGKQLGDPKYQTLMNYLNEYTSTLAPILGVGGDPTNLKTEIAQSFVNAAASGQSITDVLDSIDKLAEGKLQAMKDVGQGQYQAPKATGGNSSFGWDFLNQ